jgi:hypothetical protein
MQEKKSASNSKEQKDVDLSDEEKQENIELINNFFLIILGIVLGYFAAYATASPTVVGISVLIKALTKEATHFPILPTLHQADILSRAIGFLLLLPIAVILFPLMLTRYIRWLKTRNKIFLARELTELFFLLFWPVAALWIFSPPLTLDETSQSIQRLIGVVYVAANIGYFLYKTRSVRRGFLY